jgi:hypothetical protein
MQCSASYVMHHMPRLLWATLLFEAVCGAGRRLDVQAALGALWGVAGGAGRPESFAGTVVVAATDEASC